MRAFLRGLAAVPLLQPITHWVYRARTRDHVYNRRHPIDERLGIDTGGLIPGFLLGEGGNFRPTGYGGCVPSTVRTALGTLTDLDRASFIDLGCGKGRAMAVALEFPFRAIIGLEMNASLVATALANAAIVRRSHPNSPEWRVLRADATAPEAPEGDIVYFLANPFGRGPMEQLLAHIQKQMAPGRRIFVVYENPVQGLVFDNDPGFSRWYAAHLPYDADEIGFGPDETESVVIWAAGTATPSPHKTSGVIAVKDEVMRAEVEG